VRTGYSFTMGSIAREWEGGRARNRGQGKGFYTHQAIIAQDADRFSLACIQAESTIARRRGEGGRRLFEALEHGMNGSLFPSHPIYVKSEVGPLFEFRTA
jgi:hypothetical protein